MLAGVALLGGGLVGAARAQTSVPAKAGNPAHPRLILRGGADFSLAIVPDNSLLSFGAARAGQVSATQTVAGIKGVPVALGTGGQHVLVVTANGRVWSFGDDTWGQLGPRAGAITDPTLPARVKGLRHIVAAAAGLGHSVALAEDGSVWTWGLNSSGQLGNGALSGQEDVPAKVAGLSDIVAVAAGENHTLALRADGTVWAWGDAGHGQLGSGQVDGVAVLPCQVAALSGVVALAAGGAHNLALAGDGTVWAWGDNARGQLGDGTTQTRPQPVLVSGLENVAAIAVGHDHSLALRADNHVSAWGANEWGQLGSGDTIDHLTPVRVVGLGRMDRIGAGATHSLAGRSVNGSIWMWGNQRGTVLEAQARAGGSAATGAGGSLPPTRLSLALPAGAEAVISTQGTGTVTSAPNLQAAMNGLPPSPDAPQTLVRMLFLGQWPVYDDANYPPPSIPAIHLTIGSPTQPVAALTEAVVDTSNAFSGGPYLGATGDFAGYPADMPIHLGVDYPLGLTFAGNGYWPLVVGRVWGSPDNDTAHRANLLIYDGDKGYYLTNDEGGVWNENAFQTTGNSSMPYTTATTPTQQLVAPSAAYQTARLWAVNFDLDVDSDNRVGTALPARSAAQELIEETSAKKITIGSNALNLVPVVLEVSPDTLEYAKIRVRFEFDANSIKLWNIQDPNTTRDSSKVLQASTAQNPFYYEATTLGLTVGHAVLLFYAEGVNPSTSIPLKAIFAFNGGGNAKGPTSYGEYFHDQVLLATASPALPSFPLSADDAAGTRYRKIALNGRPLPDTKPQRRAESDEQSEESFIDALNLTLHHDTTEVYVPLPTDQLSLTVRRSAQPEVWNARSGLCPAERPDRPFGLGWSSNLGASIHFVYQTPTSGPPATLEADYASVTDEQGSSYRFVILYDAAGNKGYFPLPSSQHDQDGYQATLSGVGAGGGSPYTFTRKYGTALQFSDVTIPGLTSPLSGDRINPGATALQETHRFARLDSARDRFGVKLSCVFNDQTSPLIPSTISASANGTPLQSISVASAAGLVQRVTDPNGKVYDYAYKSDNVALVPDAQTGNIPSYPTAPAYSTLASVQAPLPPGGSTRPKTAYAFSTSTEDDASPVPATKTTVLLTPAYHCELAVITDPNGKTYTLGYAPDTSRMAYLGATQQDYVLNGSPSNVVRVDLPDGLGTTTFANHSYLALRPGTDAKGNYAPTFYGHRATYVVDASPGGTTGNGRLYDFSGSTSAVLPAVTLLNDFKPFLKNGGAINPLKLPRLVFFPEMAVTHFQGGGVTFASDTAKPTTLSYTLAGASALGQEVFTFDLGAGSALSSVKDFSGNVTSYVYGDLWAPLAGQAAFANLHLTYPINHYADPTGQTAPATTNPAQTHVKSFQYGGGYRTMTQSTDEAGRVTTYVLDALDRRTQEQIAAPGGAVAQTTLFEYGDSRFANFLTKRTIKKFAGDPAWTPPALSTDLVETYAADALGRMQSETVDPGDATHQNLTTSYLYDSNNNKTKATDARGNATAFVYSGQNRLVETDYPVAGTPPAAAKKTWVYDLRGNKTGETDENGRVTAFAYDGLNRATQVSRALADGTAIVTKAAYNAVGSKTSATDADNHTMTMVYDGLQRLTGTTDARSQTTSFSYGANAGASAFDSAGWKPTRTLDPRNVSVDLVYDALYRPASHTLTDPSQSPVLVSRVLHAYDAVGNATGETDPLGHVTSTVFDALNRPTRVTFADATTRRMLYSGAGLKYQMVDELGRTTDLQYDGAGRPVAALGATVDNGFGTPARPVVRTVYDNNGNVTATVDPLAHRWDFGFDARNRQTSEDCPAVVDAVSGLTLRPHFAWEYDAVGNKTASVDARGNRAETAYDWANRPVQVTAPPVPVAGGGATPVRPVTSTVYDPAGNVLQVTDANLHTTVNTYDQLNRLATTADAEGDTVTNGYDAVGNKTSVRDGKLQTTGFSFDGLNRNTAVTDAAGKVTVFKYDALNKTTRTDAIGQVTNYAYDARNRVTGVTYPSRAPDNRVYSFDAAGNLLGAVLPGNGDTTRDAAYTYDALNRVQSETSLGLTHAYAYDLASRRVSTTYGGTGRVVACLYDPLGRMTSLAEGGRATTYAYDLDGNPLKKTLGNGELVASAFDALNRVSRIQGNAAGGAEIYHSIYAYDAGGNVRSNQEYSGTALSARAVAMGYDRANRLTSEATTTGTATHTTIYGYDAAHNRVSKTVDGGAPAVSAYNSLNQITSSKTTSYTYDLNGNRATETYPTGTVGSFPKPRPVIGTATYGYDVENRLLVVGLPRPTPDSFRYVSSYVYAYDYRARRVLKQEITDVFDAFRVIATTQQSYLGGLCALEYGAYSTESGGGGVSVAQRPTMANTAAGGTPPAGAFLAAEYLRGPDMGGGVGGLLYSLRGEAASYYQYDNRGDVVAKTDAGGVVTYQANYEAFGTRTAQYGSNPDPQRANTKEEDFTGLLNEGMRYRDLATGVFLTRDPAGMVDGPNLYTYVNQNPWTSFDPEGLAPNFAVIGKIERELLAGGLKLGTRSVINAEKFAGKEITTAMLRGETGVSLGVLNRIDRTFPGLKIPVSLAGRPEFEKVPGLVKEEFKIKFTDSATDIRAADAWLKASGKYAVDDLNTISKNYTWHHDWDGETLSLISTDVHFALRHVGGDALRRSGFFKAALDGALAGVTMAGSLIAPHTMEAVENGGHIGKAAATDTVETGFPFSVGAARIYNHEMDRWSGWIRQLRSSNSPIPGSAGYKEAEADEIWNGTLSPSRK